MKVTKSFDIFGIIWFVICLALAINGAIPWWAFLLVWTSHFELKVSREDER